MSTARTSRKAPVAIKRALDTERRDKGGSVAAPIPIGGEPEHLDDSEHSRQDLVRHSALNKRQSGDADQRVRETDESEEQESQRRVWTKGR